MNRKLLARGEPYLNSLLASRCAHGTAHVRRHRWLRRERGRLLHAEGRTRLKLRGGGCGGGCICGGCVPPTRWQAQQRGACLAVPSLHHGYGLLLLLLLCLRKQRASISVGL